jgi:hypothetical protein
VFLYLAADEILNLEVAIEYCLFVTSIYIKSISKRNFIVVVLYILWKLGQGTAVISISYVLYIPSRRTNLSKVHVNNSSRFRFRFASCTIIMFNLYFLVNLLPKIYPYYTLIQNSLLLFNMASFDNVSL